MCVGGLEFAYWIFEGFGAVLRGRETFGCGCGMVVSIGASGTSVLIVWSAFLVVVRR